MAVIANSNLLEAPDGATAETFSRRLITFSNAPVSGTLYTGPMVVPGGLPFNTITTMVAGTGKSGGSHGWMCILNRANKVLAVTPDQTDAATTWGTPFASQPLPLFGQTDALVQPELVYVGLCIVATTMPILYAAAVALAGASTVPPALGVFSATGFSTPPALGSTIAGLVVASGFGQYYGYTT